MAQAPADHPGAATISTWTKDHWHIPVLVGLILLAAAVRFWALGRLPLGIYRDEAYEGLDALGVLAGRFSLFFQANNGREPLFVYLITPLIAVFGRTAFALRLLPALAGVLLIPSTYALGSELFGKTEGIWAAAMAAFSVWALNLSRLALRASVLPLVTALTLLCLVRGLRTRHWLTMLAAGSLLAIGLYIYLPARFSLIAVTFYALYLWSRQRSTFWWRGWLILALGLLVCSMPLVIYFVLNPGDFLGRSGQVSLFNPLINQGQPLRSLLLNIWRTFLGIFYRGDFIPRHNVPYRPFLEPLLALAFFGGWLVLGRRLRMRSSIVLLALWFGLLSLPTILAEGAPHMLRAVGLLPALYLPAAAGLAWLGDTLRPARAVWLGTALAAVALAQSGSSALLAYHTHLHSEAVYFNYESGAAELAHEINAYLSSTNAYGTQSALLDKRLWDGWPSLRFLCAPNPNLIVLTDAGTLPVNTPVNSVNGMLLVLWPFADNTASLAFLPPNQLIDVQPGVYERGDLEPEARLLYVTFRASPSPLQTSGDGVKWEHGITLVAQRVDLVSSKRLLVELYWLVEEAPGAAYTTYAHLVHGDTLVAQHDGPAAGGYYGTERWRTGDLVVDRHYLDLSQPYDPADHIIVGIYHWPDMTALKILDGAKGNSEQYELPAVEGQVSP
ncbi:MAG: glycosyltransferase family 39 protein [Anaerolineae bacterium]